MKDAKELLQHTMLSLGHPIVNVELDEGHAASAINMAQSVYKLSSLNIPESILTNIKEEWMDQYAMALLKQTLGHIRGKYKTVNLPIETIETDADRLFQESDLERSELMTTLQELKLFVAEAHGNN